MALVFRCFSGLTVLILSVIGGDQSGSSMAAVGVYVLRPDVPCPKKMEDMESNPARTAGPVLESG